MVIVVKEKVFEEAVAVVAVNDLFDCEEDPRVELKNVEEKLVEKCGGAVKLESGFEELNVDLSSERDKFTAPTVEKLELGLPVKYFVLIPTNGDKLEFDL